MFRQEYADLAIFNGLQAAQIRVLAPYLDEVRLNEGETVFKQGERAVFLYILLEGEVTVRYKPYDGPLLTVARIQAGEVFGWSAALGREVYTSDAQAVCDGLTYRIRAASLKQLCEKYPETGHILVERLADSIAERLRNTNSSVLEILNQGIEGNCNGSQRSGRHER